MSYDGLAAYAGDVDGYAAKRPRRHRAAIVW